MPTWQIIGLAALLILATGAVILNRQREECPACKKRCLRFVSLIRETIIVNGKRVPDACSYFVCESCGARIKQQIGGGFEVPSDEEWKAYVPSEHGTDND